MIRTGFIYKPATVDPVGQSGILVGDDRLRQRPRAAGPGVQGRGCTGRRRLRRDRQPLQVQGHRRQPARQRRHRRRASASTRDRIGQANGLRRRSPRTSRTDAGHRARCSSPVTSTPTPQEDPMQVLYDAGFDDHRVRHRGRGDLLLQRPVRLARPRPRQHRRDGHGDRSRRLGHQRRESVGYQYSRFNYNVTQLSTATSVRAPPTTTRRSSASTAADPTARDGPDPRHQRLPRPDRQRPGRRRGRRRACWRARSSSCGREPEHGLRRRR